MKTDKLILKMRKELEKRGKNGYTKAKERILNENISYDPVREALRYFIEQTWRNYQHPALLSLACESVGGKPEETTLVAASLVLLTGAADIHDDVIDNSLFKAGKKTVLGKFGRDMAILVGDALLVEGIMLLNEATAELPSSKRASVLDTVKNGFFELGTAEAMETSFKRNWDLTAEDYISLMRMKAAIAEMTVRLGVTLGNGNTEQVEAMSAYGRTLGFLMNIRDEFVDTYELNELRNRIANECLPLPILYAFRNPVLKKSLVSIFGKKRLTEDDVQAVTAMIMDTEDAQSLRNEMRLSLENGVNSLLVVKKSEEYTLLASLLRTALRGL